MIKLVSFLLTVAVSAEAFAADRTWTDRTGKHQVQAELIRLNGNTVELRKADGTVIALDLNTLSRADQQFAKDSLQDRLTAYHPWSGNAAKALSKKRARFSGWQPEPEAIKVQTPSGEEFTLLLSELAKGSLDLARQLKVEAQQKSKLPSDEEMTRNLEAEKQLVLQKEQARLAALGKEIGIAYVPLASENLPFAYASDKRPYLDVLNAAFTDFRAFVSNSGTLTILFKYMPPDSPTWSYLGGVKLSYEFAVVLVDSNQAKLGSLTTERGVRWVQAAAFASPIQISPQTGKQLAVHDLKFRILEQNKEIAMTFQVNARDLRDLASVKFLAQPHSRYEP